MNLIRVRSTAFPSISLYRLIPTLHPLLLMKRNRFPIDLKWLDVQIGHPLRKLARGNISSCRDPVELVRLPDHVLGVPEADSYQKLFRYDTQKLIETARAAGVQPKD